MPTLGQPLGERGFIHLSFAHQVSRVADASYAGTADLVLLRIDPDLLRAPVIVEPGEGTDERFPHLYGELPVGAVSEVRPYAPDRDGPFPRPD